MEIPSRTCFWRWILRCHNLHLDLWYSYKVYQDMDARDLKPEIRDRSSEARQGKMYMDGWY